MFAVNFFPSVARMKNQKSRIKNHSCARAFTIIECLLALAISAVLLTAVAMAFDASVTNYRENEDMFWTMNNARQALTRMTSELRTGHAVQPTAPSSQCSFFTVANANVTYNWQSAQKALYVTMNATGQSYKLCDNVTAATFTKTPTDDGTDCKAVQISLTVQRSRFQRTLAAAAVIRRNL
jgi:prepilin-type N-terminal cleavage/methylation domain-containing protein